MQGNLRSSIEKVHITPCHCHPMSLDSANTVQYFVETAAKELGKKAISFTDHGTISAILEGMDVSKNLKKKNNLDIKVIPGVELYMAPEPWDTTKKSYYHLTVHMDDFETYLKFCKLSKTAHDRAIKKGAELKPLTTFEELRSLSGHITIFSGCIISPCISPALFHPSGGKEIAERYFKELMAIAGPGRFFAEIMPYECGFNWNGKEKRFEEIKPTECCPSGKLQVEGNNWIKKLSDKYSVPRVISEDAHYAKPEEKMIQDLRLSQFGGNWKMSDANCLHTNEWLFNELKRIHPDWFNEKEFFSMSENSDKFTENFKGFEQKFNFRLPLVEVNLDTNLEYDQSLVNAVLRIVKEKGRIDLSNVVYRNRLVHEIKQLGLNGKVNILPYFLFLMKVVDWCKPNNVLPGSGRGSSAGSLLAYALEITQVDPIKEDLSFERFFDVSRVEEGLADIDMDFSDRNRVVDWLKQEYGDKFAFLGTAGTFKTKSLIKDFDRLLHGEVRKVTEEVCKTIPTSPQGITEERFLMGYTDDDGVVHEGHLSSNQALQKYLKENKTVEDYLLKTVGLVRQMGRHASGIIISDIPVDNFMPMTKISNEPTTQILPKYVEKSGGVKYDLLGLLTLEDIRVCLDLIKKRHNLIIDPWKLEDKPEVWAHIVENPETVFQLHTETVRPGLIKMKPKSIQEAAILTSVFRPGAMDAPSEEDPSKMMSDIFLERWNNESEIKYIHPSLENYLAPTVAVMVYQEQMMKVVNEVAGLSMSDTQKFRKAIGKKNAELLLELLHKVKTNLISRGWTEQQVFNLTEQMKASGKYAFNKSHAISYSYIAYACGYLKYYYPIEWWSAVLTNASKDDLKFYWQFNADKILPLDINQSSSQYQIVPKDGKDMILPPLNLIDGVGPVALSEILSKRPYADFKEFITKIDRRKIHKGIIIKLIFSGVLDSLFTPEHKLEIDKISYYFKIKSEIDDEKMKAIPTQLISMTSLQKSLIKKTVLKVYNENLLDSALPTLLSRQIIKTDKLPNGAEYTYFPESNSQKIVVANAKYVEKALEVTGEINLCVVAYVYETKEKKYQNNKKTMLLISCDVDDKNYEFPKFPDYKKDHHGIDQDIEESICLLVLKKLRDKDNFLVSKVIPIETTDFLKEEKKSKKVKK